VLHAQAPDSWLALGMALLILPFGVEAGGRPCSVDGVCRCLRAGRIWPRCRNGRSVRHMLRPEKRLGSVSRSLAAGSIVRMTLRRPVQQTFPCPPLAHSRGGCIR
jgi:hypothetical protein